MSGGGECPDTGLTLAISPNIKGAHTRVQIKLKHLEAVAVVFAEFYFIATVCACATVKQNKFN